jgi:hypothetical protein
VRAVVVLVWTVSFIVCMPLLIATVGGVGTPAAGAKSCSCEITDLPDVTGTRAPIYYSLFSAALSFYIPILLIIFIYTRIYSAARTALTDIRGNMRSIGSYSNAPTAPTSPQKTHSQCNCDTRVTITSAPVIVCAKTKRAKFKSASLDHADDSASSMSGDRFNNIGLCLCVVSGSLRRDMGKDLHRDVYAHKRADPLMASFRRLRFAKCRQVSRHHGALTTCGRSQSIMHAASEPCCTDGDHVPGSVASPSNSITDHITSRSTPSSFEDEIIFASGPNRQLNALTEIDNEDSPSCVFVAQPHATTKSNHLVITNEMMERYRLLNEPPFASTRRTDPLRQTLRHLRSTSIGWNSSRTSGEHSCCGISKTGLTISTCCELEILTNTIIPVQALIHYHILFCPQLTMNFSTTPYFVALRRAVRAVCACRVCSI